MSDITQPDHTLNLSEFIDAHIVYAYDNGWKYEWYVRNDNTCD
jgi:phenolic acid decarboxylase